MSSQPELSLVRCPNCASTMLYPVDLAGFGGDIVVSRRCPECEHRDTVLAGRVPALLWFDRYIRTRGEIAALSEALGDGLPLESDLAEVPGAGERPGRRARLRWRTN